jgi:D-threo-aldose 1-dehydrogenase
MSLPFTPLTREGPGEAPPSTLPTARLGRTGLELPRLGLGCAGLGELFTPVSEAEAEALLAAAWESGVRYFDTSPWYGRGKSEHRVGRFLWDKPRQAVTISTKVGRVLERRPDPSVPIADQWIGGLPFRPRFDFTYDGVMRSFEDSLQRLGIDSVDMLVIHDLDGWHFEPAAWEAAFGELVGSGWRALEELRSSGTVKAVGTGINQCDYIRRFLDYIPLDFALVALRLTLLEHRAFLADEMPRLVREGVGVVVGGVFSSGLGATGPVAGARFNYAPADDAILAHAGAIDAACRRHGVPLAAALQFPLRVQGVASVIPGAVRAAEWREIAGWFGTEIPDALWAELEAGGLISPVGG